MTWLSVLTGFAGVMTAALGGLAAWAVAAQGVPQDEADVLSIGGAVTEVVVALDQGHRLRARDSTSTYPPEVTGLPDVGYMRALSPEGVLSVGASLILAEEGAGPAETLEVIRAAEVDLVAVPEGLTPEAILHKIEVIGTVLGVPDRAEALAAEVGAALDEAMQDADRPEAERKRVLFVLTTQGGKINAAGQGTGADAIIRMAGGINALQGVEGYKQIGDEAVGLAAPDVILTMQRGGNHDITAETLFAMPAMRLTPAAEASALVKMDGLLLLGFGPRTAEAVTALNHALYGQDG